MSGEEKESRDRSALGLNRDNGASDVSVIYNH